MSVYVNNANNQVGVNPTFNTVNVLPDANSTIVEVITPGPQGPQGPPGDVNLLTASFVTTSSFDAFTSSYYADSASFSSSISQLQDFSSSLDVTFATDADLNALSSSFTSFTASYYNDSASFSSSISQLQDFSSSLDATFATDADLNALSSSFNSFTASYNTGSFTGSFAGDGGGLTNISASSVVGLVLSQITSGSVTASVSPDYGFKVNSGATISGSILFDGGGQVLPNYEGFSGSIDLKAGSLTGWAELQSYDSDQYIWVDNTAAYIGTNWNSGSHAWIFDRSGSMTTPGDILTNGNITSTGNITLSGSGQIQGIGSLILKPNINDARYLEIYNTAAQDTHITASGGYLFLGDDTTYVKVDNYSTDKIIGIRADNGITLSGSTYQSGTFYPDAIDWINSNIQNNTGSYILTTTANGLTTYASFQDIGPALFPYINTGSFTGSFIGAFTGSFSGSLWNLQNTDIGHIPFFSSSQVLADSAMFQVEDANGVYSIVINQNGVTTAAPEALYVWQASTSSYNVISGKGNLNNYLQLNIQNVNNGPNASSDVVATANNGDENGNYIDMGINGANFSGFLGGPNDAYLYATGNNLHIGNATPGNAHLGFFVGGFDVDVDNKLSLYPNNQHNLTGSLTITDSLTVNQGITGSLFGTSSYAITASHAPNALSASYAFNATSASYARTASYADNFTVAGVLTAQTIVAQVITSSTEYITGSTIFGSQLSNTHQFTGSVTVTGSLFVNNSAVIRTNQTSSMSVLSSSYALSASYAFNSTSASYAFNSTSASYALSSSYATSASQAINANNAVTASYILNAVSASYALSASYASGSTSSSYALNATSASYALSASQATNANNATTASYVLNAVSASYALSSSYALSASYAFNATSASYALSASQTTNALTASYVNPLTQSVNITGSLNVTGSVNISGSTGNVFTANVDTISFTGSLNMSGSVNVIGGITGSLFGTASFATSASFASQATSASFATNATSASYALSSSYASGSTSASFASNATSASYALSASYASGSTSSSYAFNATSASYALSASYAFNATSASFATNANNATTASYVLNAVSASYAISSSYAFNADLLDGKDSTEFATTGSNVFRGNQTVTGSLLTTGSNTLIGNTTLTGSLNITGSTTQIGDNSLFGNTSLSGSIIISGSQNPSTPTIQIFGDTQFTGVARFNPISRSIDNSISASYIYVSGSTNDLYFSQNGSGYANTTRLRWIEGNLYTGLLNGGLITSQSSTVYQVGSGSGIIVNLNASLNNNPYPTIQYLNWPNLSASISAFTSSYQQVFVAVDSTNNIYAQGTPFSDGQFDTVINIGSVFFQNGSTINGFKTQPSVAYGFEQSQNIFNRAFGPLKLSGFTLAPSGSSTGSLVVGSGTAYAPGANYIADPNNPSYATDSGTNTSKIFRYYQSGSGWVYLTNGGAGFTTIDPSQYSNSGSLASVGNNNWSIQRVFWFPSSATKTIIVYYGNQIYGTEADAIANLNFEPFVEAPNTAANAIYLGAIIIKGNGVFTSANDYKILPGGLFRSVGGSGGGGSTVTQTLSGLSDVSISGQTNLQPLVYSTTAGKWINSSDISGSLFGNAQTATSASQATNANTAISSSYANVATSASFATTASFAITSSFASQATSASQAISSSYALSATSASYALSASQATNANNATTASYILNAISASFATSASQATNSNTATSASYARTASYADNFTVAGTLTATTLVVQTVSSSVVYSSGSNIFGNSLSNTQVFTGSVSITGSFIVNGPATINNLTGSLFGTASFADNSLSASFATTAATASYFVTSSVTSASFATSASYATNADNALTASYVALAQTASYVLNAVSSSYATTASLPLLGIVTASALNTTITFTKGDGTTFDVTISQSGSVASASYAISSSQATTASYALTATSASFASTSTSASYALNATTATTASYVLNAISASFATTALTASFVTSSNVFGPFGSNSIISSSYSLTASFALNAGGGAGFPYSGSAVITGSLLVSESFVDFSLASYVTGSFTGSLFGTASWAGNATTASYILNAVSASYALSSSYALSASYAFNATTASYVLQAVSASFATTASYALQAVSASFASTASFYEGSVTSASYAATSSYASNFAIANTLTLDATLTDYSTIASSIVGPNNLFTQTTGSYTSAFFKYTAANGANARSGEVLAVWNGATTQFTDFSTVDIGTTSPVTASIALVGSDVQFNIQTNTSGWRIKSIATYM